MLGTPEVLAKGATRRATAKWATPMVDLYRFGRRSRWLLLGIALTFLLAACSSGAGVVGSASNEVTQDVVISLYQGSEELGGDPINISDLTGKPVVLNFWAGLCPPCRAEMPDLQDFYEEFKDKVTLVGLDVGQFTGLGNQDDARDLLNELGVTYPAGFTTDGSVMSRYKVLGMPTTAFIDANGEVFRTWTGALNKDVLAEVTNEMLSQ